jgi:hypothetical protein
MRAAHEGKRWFSVMVARWVNMRVRARNLSRAFLPRGFGEVTAGVQRESQKVEHDQHTGQGVLAVAEVVFEVIALVLQFMRVRKQSSSRALK